MDVYCPRCGEPIDVFEFHDLASAQGTTLEETKRRFALGGCNAVGLRCSTPPDRLRAEASNALLGLLGDDFDGTAAMLEDAEYAGLLEAP